MHGGDAHSVCTQVRDFLKASGALVLFFSFDHSYAQGAAARLPGSLNGNRMLNAWLRIDADGTKAGFDLIVTRRVSESVGVPVVASGGAGSLEHMAEVLLEGKADAVLAASIFHFGTYTVGDVKKFLAEKKIPVRL